MHLNLLFGLTSVLTNVPTCVLDSTTYSDSDICSEHICSACRQWSSVHDSADRPGPTSMVGLNGNTFGSETLTGGEKAKDSCWLRFVPNSTNPFSLNRFFDLGWCPSLVEKAFCSKSRSFRNLPTPIGTGSRSQTGTAADRTWRALQLIYHCFGGSTRYPTCGTFAYQEGGRDWVVGMYLHSILYI